MNPELSIVIPVYNEQESLPHLFEALYPALDGMGRTYEVIFVNDGSRDDSLAMLVARQKIRPDVTAVIDLAGNCGQHMALMAGFSQVRGSFVITLDADLQNPPSEIPRLVAEWEAGHDVVGTYREGRSDPAYRKLVSSVANRLARRTTGLGLKDCGSMLRGYDRRVIDIINDIRESTTFLPALAAKLATSPVEIPIAHCERRFGTSKYGIFQLLRLNFDLMTGFSLVPLQAVTMVGIVVAGFSFLLVCYMVARRLIIGPEVDGLFTLFGIVFFLIGMTLLCLGILGEYVGRIYREVLKRPQFLLRRTYRAD